MTRFIACSLIVFSLAAPVSTAAPAPGSADTQPISLSLTQPSKARPRREWVPTKQKPATLMFLIENDGWFLKPNHNTDRHYTNGTAIVLAYHPAWADDLARTMPDADSFHAGATAVGFVAGQLMFTPSDITLRDPPPDDEPYAGYLYGGMFWQRANAHTLDHVELNLGVVGPSSLAEDVQKRVHHIVNVHQPQGWSHQLHDEPAVQLYLRRKWRLNGGDFTLGGTRVQGQWLPEVGAALGTVYRRVQAGVTYRLGFNLPDDFGPGRIANLPSFTSSEPRRVAAGQSTSGASGGWSLYGFARVGASLVEHNIFLDGNTYRDSPSVHKRPLVGEAQLGLALAYRSADWRVALTYGQTFFTKTFYGQRGTDALGGFTLAVTHTF